MNDLEKYFAQSKKNQTKQANKRNRFRVNTKKEAMAEKMAYKADPHWDNADRPSLTKGHKIYESNK